MGIAIHWMHKKINLLFILLCLQSIVWAQKEKADSLSALLGVEKIDTNRVTLTWRLADAIAIYNPDSALILAQDALFLANRIHYIEGQSRSLGIMANVFGKMGKYAQALDYNIQKLKIEEKRNNPRNLASVLMNIGTVYVYQEQYRDALQYYTKSDSIINAAHLDPIKYNSAQNLGDLYDRMEIPDTAFIYFSKALGIALQQNNVDFIGASQTGLAHVYLDLKKYEESLANYRLAIRNLTAANDDELLCEASLGLAILFKEMKKSDSAIHYASLSLNTAKKGFQSKEFEAAKFLSNYYESQGLYEKAYQYLTVVQQLNDSINSRTKVREAQIISTNEQLRQAEIAEAKRLAKLDRDKQLQLLFIGMFIPGLFIITLILSRIRIHRKVITILGILSLLILFEFLTLLLHPFVADLTNHRPVYEILIFVSIAAILIPGHHRLEHWLIEKLTFNTPGTHTFRFRRKKIKVPIKKDPEQTS